MLDFPAIEHVVVHLKPSNAYEDKLQGIPVACLSFRNWFSLPQAVVRLKKLIRQYQAQIVHSHLYYSTIVARLACPSHVKLVTSYHSLLYDPQNTAQYSEKLLTMDRLTYKRHHHLLFVSQAVQSLVCQKVGVKSNREVLSNYVDEDYYLEHDRNEVERITLRIVMVGNLRPEKNYPTVIRALYELAAEDVVLDIYGNGRQQIELDELIRQYKLEEAVCLKGCTEQPYQVLPNYDLYVAASRFEGFGIALAEAMAAGLPCVVSDIPAHREVAGDTVMYFDPDNPESLREKISMILKTPQRMDQAKALSKQRAEMFRKSIYENRLTAVYEKILADD